MEYESDPLGELPSKTQRKKDMLQRQQLGEQLLGLKRQWLEELPLSRELFRALEEFRRLPHSHEARRRQLQFIGRLMRDVDCDAVREAIDRRNQESLRRQYLPDPGSHECDLVLGGGDQAIQDLLTRSPGLDRQKLRGFSRDYVKGDESQRQSIRDRLLAYLRSAEPR